ncbi:RxLR effector protein, partial [Phytophthora megakarya]
MRLHSIAVLSAITLLASVDATLFPKVSKVSATNFLVRPVNKGTNDVSNQRFLRIHSNDEERMPTVQAIPNIKTISRTALNMLGKHADELGLVKQMALIKQMKYSDSMLSELLIAAKKNPSTEKAATDLQNQLIRAWLEKLEPPENVFKFLMLDRAADNVLSDSQLKLWINYVYTVRKRTGKPQVSLIDNLMNNYNDKAMVKIINTAKKSPDANAKGTYVEDELLLKWAVDEKPIAYVSKMLGTTAA